MRLDTHYVVWFDDVEDSLSALGGVVWQTQSWR